jgi:hypothetical protein
MLGAFCMAAQPVIGGGKCIWRAAVKRYKMDKWWQLPFLPKPEEGKGPWSVRSILLLLIPFVVLVVFLYTVFHHG